MLLLGIPSRTSLPSTLHRIDTFHPACRSRTQSRTSLPYSGQDKGCCMLGQTTLAHTCKSLQPLLTSIAHGQSTRCSLHRDLPTPSSLSATMNDFHRNLQPSASTRKLPLKIPSGTNTCRPPSRLPDHCSFLLQDIVSHKTCPQIHSCIYIPCLRQDKIPCRSTRYSPRERHTPYPEAVRQTKSAGRRRAEQQGEKLTRRTELDGSRSEPREQTEMPARCSSAVRSAPLELGTGEKTGTLETLELLP
mmetsp:Transcript_43955/g.138758  ORF Transcript_43955/g.138758 Transcript_43955/m.138758 type:complete len:247 (-) Transcript_43955:394-1134(-)